MSRLARRVVLVFLVPAGPVVVAVGLSNQDRTHPPSFPSTSNGEWPHYGADLMHTRYSPQDQINRSNFGNLEVAWRFKTDNLGPGPEFRLQGTPLMVKGVLYATGGTRRSVVALDAKTGELLWVHGINEGKRAQMSPRMLSGRGLAYWTDGRGDERIFYVTIGYRLVALSAVTGARISSFGQDGIIDLKVGIVYGTGEQIDLDTGEIGLHATPTVANDVVVIGAAFWGEGPRTPKTHNAPKGAVRGFDARTGSLLWTFNTIPRPDEFGHDTWKDGSWADNGKAGVWAQIPADEELGLAYLPIEDPASDMYGGHRPGNNLFANSLVAVDLKTGRREWYFQLVHHPIWDMDIPSAPILADINVNGKPIKAIAQPTKQGFLYVFDRETGEPVWPIEERPVPQSDVPGEETSPTQPFPTRPPAYARNELKIPDDLIDFTPELRAGALENVKQYRVTPTVFNPPVAGQDGVLLGGLYLGMGASNWPGASYDPDTQIVYAAAGNSTVLNLTVAPPPRGASDIRYVQGIEGRRQSESGGAVGVRSAFARSLDGLPILKPPYGIISAIDLDRGDIMWQVPRGDTPDNVRNHPLLKGVNIPKTGQPGTVGSVVTKTLLIMGDARVTSPPGRPPGAMLRAYDKTTGQEVGAVTMPAGQSGSPMTYMVDGKQYIVVAVSGGNHSGEYVAFSLPGDVP